MFSRGDFWTYLWNYVIHTKPCNSATVLPFQEQRQFFTTVLCSVKKMYNLAPFNSTILGDKMTLKILMKSIEIFKKVEFESTCKEISHRGTCGISLWKTTWRNLRHFVPYRWTVSKVTLEFYSENLPWNSFKNRSRGESRFCSRPKPTKEQSGIAVSWREHELEIKARFLNAVLLYFFEWQEDKIILQDITHRVMIYTFNQDVFVLTYDGNYDVRVFVM